MSSDHTPPAKPATDENLPGGSSSRAKATSSSSSAAKPQHPPPEHALKCPRCDSPNTKFCYYNNYSLTQPRHFCKTCRRYWTKGGALRNVPIGGGCRKNKRVRSSSSNSRLSCSLDSKDTAGSSSSESMMLGGLKFFHGISPAMDFQLGGLSSLPSRLHHNPSSGINFNTQFSSFGEVSGASGLSIGNLEPSATAASCNSFLGFNYPLSLGSGGGRGGGGVDGGGFSASTQNMMSSTMNVHSSLASSIESLSSINQDLHWKLQQQRLAMLLGTADQDHDQSTQLENQQKTQQMIAPISLFQNLEVTSSKPDQHHQQVVGGLGRKEGSGGDTATEWFFGNSYAPPVTPTPTNSSGGNGGGGGGNDNTSNWHGIQAWSAHDLQQYNALP